MDSPEPVGTTKDQDCAEKHTSIQYEFMSDRWRHHMPHLRFSHFAFHWKIPLLKKLNLALERNIGPHAYVIVGDTVYRCQVFILRIYCKGLISNLKMGDVVKFPRNAMSNECFELAYAWMTSKEVYCPRDKILDFLVVAKFLQCIPMINRIFEHLNDHTVYSELTAFSCFVKARDMGITQVADMMLSRVSKCFLVLVSNGKFLQLDIDSVCTLLSSSYLAVQTEIEIFYSALLWLISNYQIRKKYIPCVLGLVRFHMMPPAFLLQWRRHLENLGQELADFLCHHLHNGMLRQNEYFMDIFQSECLASTSRRWTRDPRCPYVHLLNVNGAFDFSPKVFISYLRRIQNSPDGFIARLIMEPEAVDSTNSAETYYGASKIIKSSTRSIAGEDNFAATGTDFPEDLDSAMNVIGETESEPKTDSSKENLFCRSSVSGIAKPNVDTDSNSDSSDDPSQESSTTSTTDSFTDFDEESVHSTIVDCSAESLANSSPKSSANSSADSLAHSSADSPANSSADSPANSSADSPRDSPADSTADSTADSPVDSPAESSASSFADSISCGGDSETEAVKDSTADSSTEYATTSEGYSCTESSVCSQTDSISSDAYETDYSFEYF